MNPREAVRYGAGALGVASIGLGLWLLTTGPDPLGVLVWLAGALLLHDGVIAPLVLAAGLLLAARRDRGLLRGASIVAGTLVLIALPPLLRPGPPPNPSVLPLPYARNLLLLLAVVAATTAAVALTRRLRARRDAREE
ncbi:hypothetical protein [Streptomyces sp. NPDC048659]|uniref:hypothetical protein n=1 Tax=Streptomyces sp. NPDC048659 TaxID=3155489 RepID=UPI0034359811